MNLINFKELDSTNKYSKKHLQELQNFDVIISERQLSGYGQWGRKWLDTGDKNIYMTIILKPERIDIYTDIVRYTAICICNVLKKYSVNPKIKLPNDILVNNKKICGILAEGVTKGEILKGIVIGIGLNLNTDIETLSRIDQPATSLNIETGNECDKNLIISEILEEFESNYSSFLKKEFNLQSFL